MPVYSNDLINFIDLTSVTSLYLPKIDEMKNEVVSRIDAKALPKEVFGKKCGFNTQNQCIFFDICFPKLKEKGNITEYMQTRKFGPDKLSKEDLINKGKFMLTDIERSWLTNKNNLIQRDSFENNTVHINKHKIKAGIRSWNILYIIWTLRHFHVHFLDLKAKDHILSHYFNFQFI